MLNWFSTVLPKHKANYPVGVGLYLIGLILAYLGKFELSLLSLAFSFIGLFNGLFHSKAELKVKGGRMIITGVAYSLSLTMLMGLGDFSEFMRNDDKLIISELTFPSFLALISIVTLTFSGVGSGIMANASAKYSRDFEDIATNEKELLLQIRELRESTQRLTLLCEKLEKSRTKFIYTSIASLMVTVMLLAYVVYR